MNAIQTAVNEFFGTKQFCYATPGTDNHSANFYGDTYICKLTRDDVEACIETARDNWNGATEQSAIDDVLADLQLDSPQ
jgi:hypothetical protein